MAEPPEHAGVSPSDEPASEAFPGTTHAVCTQCGCVCDDLKIEVRENSLLGFSPDCRGADEFFRKAAHPAHTSTDCSAEISGSPASLPEALDAAAEILRQSAAPLIYGLSRSSTPGQRAAVGLADHIGAIVDTTASNCHAPSLIALQMVGEATATLGEIRQKADQVVYWGSDPEESHPRHLARFCRSDFGPTKRVTVITPDRCATVPVADEWLAIEPNKDLEILTALRQLLAGRGTVPEQVGGLNRHQLQSFLDHVLSGNYTAIFFGLGLTRGPLPHVTIAALLQFVTEVNAHTRCVARRMRVPGDVAGADSVLCWQTGYPFSVALNQPSPRYGPGEFTASRILARREVDSCILVGCDGVMRFPERAGQALQDLPTIVIDAPGAEVPFQPTVRFRTGIYGIHHRGTAYRMDEVPIPLYPWAQTTLPADHEILHGLLKRLQNT